jgi:biopolymer transport protein ExbB
VNPLEWFARHDALSATVSLVLLGMSVSSWVVLLWKGWLLQRAGVDLHRSTLAF